MVPCGFEAFSFDSAFGRFVLCPASTILSPRDLIVARQFLKPLILRGLFEALHLFPKQVIRFIEACWNQVEITALE